MASDDILVTCTTPVNIAVIKYWGKRDEKLMLPLNSSLSGALDQDDMKTTTSVLASSRFTEDALWLNGEPQDMENKRIKRVFELLRQRAPEELKGLKLRVVSVNNFPTAAGLASSASGYACLVCAIAKALRVEGDLSAIARMGSGSASRSVYGGWVKWEMGQKEDGTDSIALQVAPAVHWPLNVLVCVVSDKKKETSSSAGMQLTAATSPLMPDRLKKVPDRMARIEAAIQAKDFATFAQITMEDSDEFHETCHTTTPPIHYMTDVSRAVVSVVKAFNACAGTPRAAYTFDAGPNAVIYLPSDAVPELLGALVHFFPAGDGADNYVRKASSWSGDLTPTPISDDLKGRVEATPAAGALRYILHTRVGEGPRDLPASDALVDTTTGSPK